MILKLPPAKQKKSSNSLKVVHRLTEPRSRCESTLLATNFLRKYKTRDLNRSFILQQSYCMNRPQDSATMSRAAVTLKIFHGVAQYRMPLRHISTRARHQPLDRHPSFQTSH